MNIKSEFIDNIKSGHFIKAKNHLTKENIIDVKDDKDGNFFHWAMVAFCYYWENIIEPLHKENNKEEILNKKLNKIDYINILIDKLFELNIPYYKKNDTFPIDIIVNFCTLNISFSSIKNLKKIMLSFQNKYDEYFLRAGRKYVPKFELFRSTKKSYGKAAIPNKWENLEDDDGVPELTLHHRQAIYANYLKNNDIATAPNIAIANLGFLISKGTIEESNDGTPKFITLPIVDLAYGIIKARPVKDGNKSHSEFILTNYLLNEGSISNIVCNLLNEVCLIVIGYQKHKVKSIILDVFTTQESCYDCEASFNDFKADFVKKLTVKLTSVDIGWEVSKNLPFIIRVSCNKKTTYTGYPNLSKIGNYAAVYEKYPNDIKYHDTKSMLHLFPTERESNIISNEERKNIGRTFVKVEADIKLEKINELLRRGFFSICQQTAFVSGNGSYADKTWYQLKKTPGEILKFNKIEDLTLLSSVLKRQ